MASQTGVVWAIDIGNNSLKALRLSNERGIMEVTGFANIRHSKILNGEGVSAAERNELIALSLRQFLSENNLGKDEVIISVPSQNSFARFVTLPPVEKKRIPEIVKFEAAQQIPFDINDVQWDWQLMSDPDSAEKQVGLFAIKNEIVTAILEHFSRESIMVSYVQMVPMALYNYILYDRPDLMRSNTEATVLIDIGAENTDLVVCSKSGVWQRSIPMGGNAFTRSISEAFKLNFEKAEKLKRTAPMSKYARQIFQAMRPVFSDLAAEIQRSLGFYTSSNSNIKLERVLAFGGGAKMRGLLKYLSQTLQIPMERPETFKNINLASEVSAAEFHENVSDFGIVYGLGLQGLGLAKIESNLLPRSIARSMAWSGKAKQFIFAAMLLMLVALLGLGRTFYDKAVYNSTSNVSIRNETKRILADARDSSDKLSSERNKASKSKAVMSKAFEIFDYRDIVPFLHQTLLSVFPNENNTTDPEQLKLLRAFAAGDVETVNETPRKERKQLFITSMSIRFSSNIEASSFGDIYGGGRRRDTEDNQEDEEMMQMMGMAASKYKFARSISSFGRGGAKAEIGDPGFVVTIEGYSPYKDIASLLDPPGVGADRSKWGVVTKLLHLSDVVEGAGSFELYKKGEGNQFFQLQKGYITVDYEDEMPVEIGIIDTIEQTGDTAGSQDEQILRDPMTREIISRVAELDENGREKTDRNGSVIYQVNDSWFRLNVKFLWKGAPKTEEM